MQLASPTPRLGSLLRPMASSATTTTSVPTSSLGGSGGDLARPARYVHFIARSPGQPATTLDDLEQLHDKLASRMSEGKLKSDDKMVMDGLTIMCDNLKLIRDSLKTRNNKVDANLSEHDKKLHETEQALEAIKYRLDDQEGALIEVTETQRLLIGLARKYRSFADATLLRSLLDESRFHVAMTFVNVIPNEFITDVIMNKYDQSRTSVLWFRFKEVLDAVYMKFHESDGEYLYQTKPLLESDLPFTEIYVGQVSRTASYDSNVGVVLEGENDDLALVRKLGFFVPMIILYYTKQKRDIELVERKRHKQLVKSARLERLAATLEGQQNTAKPSAPVDPRDPHRFDLGVAGSIRSRELWIEFQAAREEAKRQEREAREAREAAKTGRKRKGPDDPDSGEERKPDKGKHGSRSRQGGTESGGSGSHDIIASPRVEPSDHSSTLTDLPEDAEMDDAEDKPLDSDAEARAEGAARIRKDSVACQELVRLLTLEYDAKMRDYQTVRKGLQVVLDDSLRILAVLQESLVRIATNQFTHYRPEHLDDYFNAAKRVEDIVISTGIELTGRPSDLKGETQKLTKILYKLEDYYDKKLTDIEEQIDKYLETNFAGGEAEHNIAGVNYDVINLVLKLEQLQRNRATSKE
ncbi:uncharacterized protein FOMMEDRAFT_142738 [Fomitiporia mediterranea MF3/22]|uniref:uncharacterized protein n=1 Tax=Fomitiporia mediterranea (strain MF3/22) TaxID=694068 RepID=UPI000440990F|nr:uncharacterized protein FOMMEDRAFT_142738 [Fomitiporia mediterranea MF3/22]EJC99418.1 hypothetical protein FOMMEDRAFT_142738 [Fomitiporia mediterranea MF3/22]